MSDSSPVRDYRNLSKYLSSDVGSELFHIRKRVLLIFSCFMLAVYAFSIYFTIAGIEGMQSANWLIITLIRTMLFSLVVLSLALVVRNKLEAAVNLLILVQSFSAFNSALYVSAQRTSFYYIGIIISFIFAIEIINLFKSDLKTRLILNTFLFVAALLIGFWYIETSLEQDKQLMTATIYLVCFLLSVIVATSLLSAIFRNALDQTVVQKTLFDSVTGLPNEIVLLKELSEVLTESHKSESKLAVLGLHICRLDKINRKYGYDTGDTLLKDIAQRLIPLSDQYDLYRVQGALLVFIPRFPWTAGEAEIFLERFTVLMKKPLVIRKEPVEPVLGLFGTESPHDGRSAVRLVSNIHNLMARSDQKGHYRNHGIEWFDHDSYLETKRRHFIEEGLKEMIRKQEYTLMIQPKYNMADNTIHGGEFLSRWKHPRLGLISPREFIPLLDENDLLIKFTKSIARHFLDFLEKAQVDRSRKLVLAINLNANSIMNKPFLDFLMDISREIKPFILEVELTEDVFLMIDDDLKENLSLLKSQGIRIALDDFGTGFSNLSYLQELNVDTIKIDKKFITPLSSDGNSFAIVRALIEMAHSFNIIVVSEGVEDETQISILRELGCDIIQGFAYSRPVSLDDFLDLLRNDRN